MRCRNTNYFSSSLELERSARKLNRLLLFIVWWRKIYLFLQYCRKTLIFLHVVMKNYDSKGSTKYEIHKHFCVFCYHVHTHSIEYYLLQSTFAKWSESLSLKKDGLKYWSRWFTKSKKGADCKTTDFCFTSTRNVWLLS